MIGCAFISSALLVVLFVPSVLTVTHVTLPNFSNFTDEVTMALATAGPDDYIVFLENGTYTGCGPSSISLSPGSAISVTFVGAPEHSSVIDCEDTVLLAPLFDCAASCNGALQGVKIMRVTMTTASPDNVGAFLTVHSGGGAQLASVWIDLCRSVTHGSVLPLDLVNTSSVVRVEGELSSLVVINSSLSSNTAETGVFSAQVGSSLFISGCFFSTNTGGGASSTRGLGGAISVASGATVNVLSSVFEFTTANSRGGIVYAFEAASVSLVDCLAVSSRAKLFGGILYAQYGVSVNLSNFVAETTRGGFIYADGNVNVSLDGIASSVSNAITGGFASIVSSSILLMSNSSVLLSSATVGGFAVAGDDANVTLFDVHFDSVIAFSQGGLFLCKNNARVMLEGVTSIDTVAYNDGSIAYVDDGSWLSASRCIFSLTGGSSGVYVTESSLSLSAVSLDMSSGATGLLFLLSSLNLSEVALSCGSFGLVGVLSSVAVHASIVTSSTEAAVLSASVAFAFSETSMIGLLASSFSGVPTTFTATFMGTVAVGSPVLECTPTLNTTATFLCGSGGNTVGSSGVCGGSPIDVAAPDLLCHDACVNASFCAPAPAGNGWVDALGCPLCGGRCEAGTYDCEPTSSFCYDLPYNTYMCQCRNGYETGLDPSSCDDIDECSLSESVCSAPRTICVNSPGSYSCPCAPGYVLVGDDCLDEDECELDSSPCDALASCTNIDGSYVCSCPGGFYGNGSLCTSCPTHMTTIPQGAITIQDCFCEPYYFKSPDAEAESPCDLCPPGSYSLNSNQCLKCPLNTFSTTANQTDECIACPEASTTNGLDGASSCECLPFCEASGEPAQLLCTQVCPPGRSVLGRGCPLCGVGFYSTSPNSPTCIACPQGSTTATDNATALSDCVCETDRVLVNGDCSLVCPPGSEYVIGANACVLCAENFYWVAGAIIGSCLECPFGSSTNGSVGAVGLSACLCNDDYAFDESRGWCAIQCLPGFSVAGLASCELCGPSTYSTTVNSLTCQPCVDNASCPPGSTSPLACECNPSFYVDGDACSLCPAGAMCAGGDEPPVAQPGFEQVSSGAFVACVPAEACVGANQCESGYSGKLCAECSQDFYRVNGRCRPCGWSNGFAMAVLVLALVIGSIAWITLTSQTVGESLFTVATIGLSSIQLISLFGELPFVWPPALTSLFMTTGSSSFDLELVGIECFVGPRSASALPIAVFAAKWGIFMALPLFAAGGLVLGALGTLLIHRLSGVALVSPSSTPAALESSYVEVVGLATLRAFAYALSALYLPLSVQVFSAYDCVKNGDGETRVLFSDRAVVCEGPEYERLLGTAVVLTFVYVMAVPAVLVATILFLRKRLNHDDFYRAVGGFSSVYREDAYAFEAVVLLRKLALAASLSMFFRSPFIRLGLCIFFITVAMIVSQTISPYASSFHNKVDKACLGAIALIFNVGVMYMDTQAAPAISVVVLFLVLLFIVSVAVAFVVDARAIMSRTATAAREAKEKAEAAAVLAKEHEEQQRLSTLSSVKTLESIRVGDSLGSMSLDSVRVIVRRENPLNSGRHEGPGKTPDSSAGERHLLPPPQQQVEGSRGDAQGGHAMGDDEGTTSSGD